MPDIITSQVFSDGEKGITATKMNNIVTGSVIQPAFYSAKPASPTLDPADQLLELKGNGAFARVSGAQLISSVAGQLTLADATQNGMLRQVSGLTTDYVDGTNHCRNLLGVARSFNAIGNPNFEVDQRNVGLTVPSPANGALVQDRWGFFKSGAAMVVSSAQKSAAANEVLLPGTNFAISRKFQRFTLTTVQASLAANDYLMLSTQLEGTRFRELQYDVHSVSLLVRSSVSGLTFGLTLQDPATSTKSLSKLCTLGAANTWTLISLPNLPVWPAGNFSSAPGFTGYLLRIVLAAGSSVTTPANDAWQNGNFWGALGQSNFANNVVSSTFDIAFVQHEPGAFCSPLIDKSFNQNYDECLRYFQKSYDLDTPVASLTSPGFLAFAQTSTTLCEGSVRFHKPMAKIPTVTCYDYSTGATGQIYLQGLHYNATIASGKSGFGQVVTSTAPAPVLGATGYFHYIADTGW